MRNSLILPLLVSVLVFSLWEAGVCQSELEWVNLYEMEVRQDGLATWMVQRKTFFESEYDEAMFMYYSSLEYHDYLSSYISGLVKNASLKTGRWEMANGPLTIKSNVFRSGVVAYGVVTYEFEWTGFARVVDDSILVGDAFVDGVFLFGDGEFVIEYPEGYVISDVKPSPGEVDELNRTILWREVDSFDLEEMSVRLRKRQFMDVFFEHGLMVAAVIGAVGATFAGFWLLRGKWRGDEGTRIPEREGIVETEDDEEMVIGMIKAAEGGVYQSAITKRSGFSKAKTSLLLKDLEKRGVVKREKRGRTKLVTLTEKGEEYFRRISESRSGS